MNNRMFNDKLKSHSLYHRKYKYDSFYLKFFANQRKILETKWIFLNFHKLKLHRSSENLNLWN